MYPSALSLLEKKNLKYFLNSIILPNIFIKSIIKQKSPLTGKKLHNHILYFAVFKLMIKNLLHVWNRGKEKGYIWIWLKMEKMTTML